MRVSKILAMLIGALFVCTNANAATFSFSDSQLKQFYEINTGSPWDNADNPAFSGSNPVTFSGTFESGITDEGTWIDGPQLGDEWGPNYNSGMKFMGWLDLSVYDTFALNLKNTSTLDKAVGAQLFFNTGYTDSGENDVPNHSSLQWIEKSNTASLSWDISSIANKEHVTAIGFKLGTTHVDGYSLDSGDNWQVKASSVPIPGAVWLLGSGLLGLIGFRRKMKG